MAGISVTTIRPLRVDDIAAALRIEQATYPQPWTEGIFREELEQPGRVYLAAEEGGRLLGYAGLMLVDGEAHVTTVTVDPERRGGRVGTRLMVSLVESALAGGAVSLTLEVRVSNERAQALYRHFGMAPVGVRKAYYGDEDAIVMWAHDIDGAEYARRLDDVRRTLR